MEENKHGRGRPRLDVPNSRYSRRQAVNSMYVNKAAQLISEAATGIPDGSLLWRSDETTWTIKSKDGILEQIGRMLVQDHHEQSHCVYIANLAIAALKNGCTCREIEKAIRKIRMTLKESTQSPASTDLISVAGQAVTALRQMGER
ncbi:MAG: hypothetical protein IJZ57_06745 [Clostridia bacterium]|nr:hypothetical protein [Clostridia bacterium]